MISSKTLGSILLILSTCLGGGIIGLPSNNALVNFSYANLLLVLVWACMTYCSFLILRVSKQFVYGTNFYTMAQALFKKPGQIITLISYLCLLYSLLGAYTLAGGEIIEALGSYCNVSINSLAAKLIFLIIFSSIVFHSMISLDIFNRVLILLKLGLFVFIIAFGFSSISVSNYTLLNSNFEPSIALVMCTSFGFGVILPSLRQYLKQDDILNKVVLYGSLVPLGIYFLWSVVITGVIGIDTLNTIAKGINIPTKTINAFNNVISFTGLKTIFIAFSNICVLTSFLGIARSMMDFMSDSLPKNINKKSYIYLLTFFPSIIWILLAKDSYLLILAYAGFFCVILHILVPIYLAHKAKLLHKLDYLVSILITVLTVILLIKIFVWS
jgi:tyrosine-specific transport protein